MKHWEFEVIGTHLRAEWNESATFNMQSRSYDGQWVDYHCFTVYGIESDQEALKCILEVIKEELKEDESLWEYLEENQTEMEEAVRVL
tara:strand:+ start:230 stop:493 length:264 start_codon:yes stop_codon:yes gene_type:complete